MLPGLDGIFIRSPWASTPCLHLFFCLFHHRNITNYKMLHCSWHFTASEAQGGPRENHSELITRSLSALDEAGRHISHSEHMKDFSNKEITAIICLVTEPRTVIVSNWTRPRGVLYRTRVETAFYLFHFVWLSAYLLIPGFKADLQIGICTKCFWTKVKGQRFPL